MIKAPDELQDLRRKIYAKAKAEPHWRFWGLYVDVCQRERVLIRLALGESQYCSQRIRPSPCVVSQQLIDGSGGSRIRMPAA